MRNEFCAFQSTTLHDNFMAKTNHALPTSRMSASRFGFKAYALINDIITFCRVYGRVTITVGILTLTLTLRGLWRMIWNHVLIPCRT